MTLDPDVPADPRSLLPGACEVIDAGIHAGWHTGAQVCIRLASRVIADFGQGLARPGVAMTAETIMLWMSSGKPIGAAAIMQLVERGQLDLDAPIANSIPEFAAGGKQAVTVRQLLVHTGGFRWVDAGHPQASWDETIARICAAKLERDWTPGEKAGYHPYTSWYILGELVRRIDGRPFERYVREEIFLPLAMNDSWIGMPLERYQAYALRQGWMMNVERDPPVVHAYDSELGATACVPGGNAHGPMHDLARFYQMLLGGGELDGARVLQAATVAQMTARTREGMFDETFKHTMDWGLGIMVDSNRYGADTVPYGYGRYSSPRAFGHGGAQSSLGMADPEYQLVVTAVFNGMPGERRHNERNRAFMTAVYEDLRLGT